MRNLGVEFWNFCGAAAWYARCTNWLRSLYRKLDNFVMLVLGSNKRFSVL